MTARRGGARRRSRQAALQALYAAELGTRSVGAADAEANAEEDAAAESSPERALQRVAEHFELPEAAFEFARELVLGITAERDAIDAKLQSVSHNWKLARMSVVDRNVLRIAAFELGAGAAPPEVVINEAIELARRFGDDSSPRFVNGILGALIERPGETGKRKKESVRSDGADGLDTPVEPTSQVDSGEPTLPTESGGQGGSDEPDDPGGLDAPGEPTPPAPETPDAKP